MRGREETKLYILVFVCSGVPPIGHDKSAKVNVESRCKKKLFMTPGALGRHFLRARPEKGYGKFA